MMRRIKVRAFALVAFVATGWVLFLSSGASGIDSNIATTRATLAATRSVTGAASSQPQVEVVVQGAKITRADPRVSESPADIAAPVIDLSFDSVSGDHRCDTARCRLTQSACLRDVPVLYREDPDGEVARRYVDDCTGEWATILGDYELPRGYPLTDDETAALVSSGLTNLFVLRRLCLDCYDAWVEYQTFVLARPVTDANEFKRAVETTAYLQTLLNIRQRRDSH